jgi:hypothetical protein
VGLPPARAGNRRATSGFVLLTNAAALIRGIRADGRRGSVTLPPWARWFGERYIRKDTCTWEWRTSCASSRASGTGSETGSDVTSPSISPLGYSTWVVYFRTSHCDGLPDENRVVGRRPPRPW